jgi:antitoxin component of MazEF toxin-antitoxin module
LKLQKQLSRRKERKEYAKWVIVVPPSKVKELGWKEGEELVDEISEGKLVIAKLTKKRNSTTA